jgi:V8-like Glu-specific endopeptidase
MPKAMQEQADRVFMVFSKKMNQPIGTAYLVYNDGKTTLFSTARHVIMPGAIQTWSEYLTDLVLLQKASWQNGVNTELNYKTKLKVEELSALAADTKDWQFSGSAVDVGLIKAESNPDLPLVSLKNLGSSIRNRTRKLHFILGYPITYFKDGTGSRIAKTQLSLSSGEVSYEVAQGEKFVLESTADSRSGNSGSPVFSIEGQLLGILSGGGKSNGYVKFPLMNSKIVPIDYLKIHLGNYLMKRKSNIVSCRGSIKK